MRTLTIRNLDDAVVEKLKQKAKANNRSLEAEARVALEASAQRPSRHEVLAELDRIAAMTPKGVKQIDSLQLLHEGREERMRRLMGDDKTQREESRKKHARRR
jgi:plasmid stability protein